MVVSINSERVETVLYFFNLPLELLAEENNTAIRSRQALMLPVGYRPGGLPRHVVLRQWLVQRVARVGVKRVGRILARFEILHRHVLFGLIHQTAVFGRLK